MRIVFATDNYWPRVSGLAVSIDSFKQELEARGHEVHVFAPIYKGVPWRGDLPRVHRFPASRVLFSKEDRLVRFRAKRLVWAHLERVMPDIIHIHSEVRMGRFCLKYALEKKIPVVITAHTHWVAYGKKYFPLLPESLIRKVIYSIASVFYNKADLNLTPTHEMAHCLINQKQMKEVVVLPTGINPKELASSDQESSEREEWVPDYASKLPKRGQKRILLYVGRIGPEKNLIFLFRVFMELTKSRQDVHFVLAGDGPYRHIADKIVRQTGLRDKVTFLGFVPRKGIAWLYAYADLFIFASKTETQGLVPLEAMMCGTPVVALGKMGVKDIIGPQKGGIMAPDDVGQFTAAVARFLDNPDFLAEKQNEAREYANEWRSDKLAKKLEDHYRKVLTKRAESPDEMEKTG